MYCKKWRNTLRHIDQRKQRNLYEVIQPGLANPYMSVINKGDIEIHIRMNSSVRIVTRRNNNLEYPFVFSEEGLGQRIYHAVFEQDHSHHLYRCYLPTNERVDTFVKVAFDSLITTSVSKVRTVPYLFDTKNASVVVKAGSSVIVRFYQDATCNMLAHDGTCWEIRLKEGKCHARQISFDESYVFFVKHLKAISASKDMYYKNARVNQFITLTKGSNKEDDAIRLVLNRNLVSKKTQRRLERMLS